MRGVGDPDQITPLGHWIRQYGLEKGCSVTNLDYIVEDYDRKKVLLIEEKQRAGKLHPAQKLTMSLVDHCMRQNMKALGYDYWGFFLVVLPEHATLVGPGLTINGVVSTVEDLRALIRFDRMCVKPMDLSWYIKKILEDAR